MSVTLPWATRCSWCPHNCQPSGQGGIARTSEVRAVGLRGNEEKHAGKSREDLNPCEHYWRLRHLHRRMKWKWFWLSEIKWWIELNWWWVSFQLLPFVCCVSVVAQQPQSTVFLSFFAFVRTQQAWLWHKNIIFALHMKSRPKQIQIEA